nr:helicase-related protein [Liquorilactobacillus satsumensis]
MPVLIYFSSKKKADELSQLIRAKTSLRTAAYHAGLAKSDRYSIQQQFMQDQLDVICATSAFGMGINKKKYSLYFALSSSRGPRKLFPRSRTCRKGSTAQFSFVTL